MGNVTVETLGLLDINSVGPHIDVDVFVEHMPEKLCQQFRQDLHALQWKQISTLSKADRKILNRVIGLHNHKIVQICMEDGFDLTQCSERLQQLIAQKKKPKEVRVSMSGYMLWMTLAQSRISERGSAASYS